MKLQRSSDRPRLCDWEREWFLQMATIRISRGITSKRNLGILDCWLQPRQRVRDIAQEFQVSRSMIHVVGKREVVRVERLCSAGYWTSFENDCAEGRAGNNWKVERI